jgi:D-lactate dehydrogenase
MLDPGPMELDAELRAILSPERVLTRRLDRVAFANDASVYRLVPRAVVFPTTIAEVQALFRLSREHGVPIVFRAAGTSLSGQAVTDGILVVVSRHWRRFEVEESGLRVRFEPGVLAGLVNQHLRRHGTKIGPDPASIEACMLGGILANNSSGMCCGVEQNAYRTLRSIRVVLPEGAVVDSALPDANERMAEEAPRVYEGLARLRQRIVENGALAERIRTKYRTKNTMGYSLNAFVDFERPIDILAHLMIGSEGTLGFIAEAVLDTVPDPPLKYTGLLFYPDLADACASIAALRDAGARTLELMDRASLRAVAGQPGVPPEVRELPERATAILAEYQCADEATLAAQRAMVEPLLARLPLLARPEFTRDPGRQAALWRVRRGIIPSVGALRARGTSFVMEDVVFPVARLHSAVAELRGLLDGSGYPDASVFGHAKDGNLHFVLTQAFERPEDVRRYDRLMHALADLVVTRYDGALKAEHGTGRNMAPFVLTEWGPEAYAIFHEIKELFDPAGILSPGVIMNTDPRAHVRHLKDLPAVEAEVDACIECGFCERTCPSRDLTLTPRQRIVVRREMARLRAASPESVELSELEQDYVYAGLETCAADGLCSLACPVGIDTGALVKRLRHAGHGAAAEELAAMLAARFGLLETLARTGLRTGHALSRLLGPERFASATRAISRWLGRRVPAWEPGLPHVAAAPANGTVVHPAAVLFPTCASRVLGTADGSPLADVVARVSLRAGAPLFVPPDARGTCCGLAFSSKGFHSAAAVAANHAIERLWDWSNEGAVPVVVDASPCTLTLKGVAPTLSTQNRARHAELSILDGVEHAARLVAAGLTPAARRGSVVLHPACSLRRMGLVAELERVAKVCAEDVVLPFAAGCCGSAGDRGLAFPELTRAALAPLAAELSGASHDDFVSTSRTCEIGLARETGRPFRSFWHLFDADPLKSET